MKRSAVEIKRRGFLLFYFFSTISTCPGPIDSGPGAVVVYIGVQSKSRGDV
jgi:hypothetical protein